MSIKWHQRYLSIACTVSCWSKDPDKKVGAVITDGRYIRGVGFNGFPTGLADTEERLHDKQIKLDLMVHAEVNAILAAQGSGDTIYIYPCMPCSQCLGKIIQAGIKTVVVPELTESQLTDSKWNPEFVTQLAQEAKIKVVFI